MRKASDGYGSGGDAVWCACVERERYVGLSQFEDAMDCRRDAGRRRISIVEDVVYKMETGGEGLQT